eukprot:1531910-Pyramimonas_sp.AAC.1
MWPSSEGVSRAGWALAHVKRLGSVMHAAFGPVPLSFGLRQTAEDGSDLAIHVLARVGRGPFQLHVGCQSTLNALRGGLGTGSEAGAPSGR